MMLINKTAEAMREAVENLMPQLDPKAAALAKKALKRVTDLIQQYSIALASGDEESQKVSLARLEIVVDTIADLQAVADIKFLPTVLEQARAAVTTSLQAAASKAFDIAARAVVEALVAKLSARWPG